MKKKICRSVLIIARILYFLIIIILISRILYFFRDVFKDIASKGLGYIWASIKSNPFKLVWCLTNIVYIFIVVKHFRFLFISTRNKVKWNLLFGVAIVINALYIYNQYQITAVQVATNPENIYGMYPFIYIEEFLLLVSLIVFIFYLFSMLVLVRNSTELNE